MYPRFGLTLMVTHACNLRCTYCYTGLKMRRAMPLEVALHAIDRAAASVAPGGTLELGFFGGEPLLEADLLQAAIGHAREVCAARGLELTPALTTNGTVTDPAAWLTMLNPDLELSISCDGLPEIHDRHRLSVAGQGTSALVLATIQRLVQVGRAFNVIVVVRPDTVDALPQSIAFLRDQGVRTVQPSLDLWTTWDTAAIRRLERVVGVAADLWRYALPGFSVNWFDEKLGPLLGMDMPATARCGFGDGEVAVAPSGRLYPCERLIGEDPEDHPLALPGHALAGSDFLEMPHALRRAHETCTRCAMDGDCNTTCRCSNYVRTGNVATPDGLLCALNQACLVETARALNEPVQLSISIPTKGA